MKGVILAFLSILILLATHVGALADTNIVLTLGTTYRGEIAEPGEVDFFVFTAASGQRLFYDALDDDFDAIAVQLLAPSGGSLHAGNADRDAGPLTLTEPGVYRLFFDATGDVVGDYTFRLLDPMAAPVVEVGTAVSAQISPGLETDIFRFPGTAGTRETLSSLFSSGLDADWRLADPANRTLASVRIDRPIDDVPITLSGSHFVLVDGKRKGSTPLLYEFRRTQTTDAPVEVSGLGVDLSGTVNVGETNTMTFTAPAGLPVYFDSLTPINSLYVSLADPTGSVVFSGWSYSDAGPYILPWSGTYTVALRGSTASASGAYRFRMLDLSAAPELPQNAEVGETLDAPFKTDVYQMSGTAGQRMFYDAIDADNDNVRAQIQSPAGALMVNVNSDTDHGPFALPHAGTYYVFLSSGLATATDYRFSLLNLADQTEVNLDTLVSATLDPGRSTTLHRLEGVAGQRLYFDSLATSAGASWHVYAPGDWIVGGSGAGMSTDMELTLPVTGSYVLALIGAGVNPISYSYRIVSPDLSSSPLTLNGDTSGDLTEPGEEHVFTFTGTVGQRLYYDAVDADIDNIRTYLYNPAGGVVFTVNSDTDRGPFTLDRSGAYRLVVDGVSDVVGDYHFRLLDLVDQPSVNADETVTATLTPGWSTSLYRLEGAAGQRLYFDSLASSVGASWYLYRPGDKLVAGAGVGLSSDMEIILPVGGTYALALIGASVTPVPYSFRIVTYETPSNVLTLNTDITGELTEPGEQHSFTFHGMPGQRLYYDALDSDLDNIRAYFFDPSGDQMFTINSDVDHGPFTLDRPGAYRLVIDGLLDVIGDYHFQLLDLADQELLSLDEAVNGTVNPGNSATLYRLAGTAGQRLYVDSLASSAGASWYLYRPGDELVAGAGSGLSFDMEITLPVGGTYAMVLIGASVTPVPYSFRIVTYETPSSALTLNTDTAGELTAVVTYDTPEQTVSLGDIIAGEISEPGEMDTYTFSGLSGQRLYYDALEADFDQVYVLLLDPEDSAVFINGNSDHDVGPFTLVDSGTYQLVIYGAGDLTGDYRFRLLDIAEQPQLELDTLVNLTLELGWESRLFRHDGVSGQALYFDSLSTTGGGGWYWHDPNNGLILYGALRNDLDTVSPQSGEHVLVVSSASENPVSEDFIVVTRNDNPDVTVNRGPILALIPDQKTGEYVDLTFAASAQDPDPTDGLVFSLDTGAPDGAVIDPSTGTFNWTPPGEGISRIVEMTVRATDTGVPSLSAAQTVHVLVIAGPVMITVERESDGAMVIWNSAPEELYGLQYKDTVEAAEWTDLDLEIPSSGFILEHLDDTVGDRTQRFYRVILFKEF